MAWDQTADAEEGTLADWDGYISAQDKIADFEEGDTTDFDGENDPDGDLNAAAGAAKVGSYGIEITYDDANGAWGRLDLGAVNQTTFFSRFYIHLNDAAVGSGKAMYIAIARDGAPAWIFSAYVTNTSGNYYLAIGGKHDGGTTYTGGSTIVNDSAWHEIIMLGQISSAPGADDGFYYLILDGQLEVSQTGVDNDTLDFDDCVYGMIYTNQTTQFGGSFYMDEIYLDPLPCPVPSPSALSNGSYGWALPYLNTHVYGQLNNPVDETESTIEVLFDPNSAMPSGSSCTLVQFVMDTVGAVAVVQVRNNGGVYEVRIGYKDDGATWTYGSWHTEPTDDYNNQIFAYWKASSAGGADDGRMQLWHEGVLLEELTGLDNDTHNVDIARGGIISAASFVGGEVIFIDDFRWNDEVASFSTPDVSRSVARVDPGTTRLRDASHDTARAILQVDPGTTRIREVVANAARVFIRVTDTHTSWVSKVLRALFKSYVLQAPEHVEIESSEGILRAGFRDYTLTADKRETDA